MQNLQWRAHGKADKKFSNLAVRNKRKRLSNNFHILEATRIYLTFRWTFGHSNLIKQQLIEKSNFLNFRV